MTKEEWTQRLNHLEEAHAHQHSIVEALEAENAPDDVIKKAKVVKLNLKDQIEMLKELAANAN
jgi:hypothetical protein